MNSTANYTSNKNNARYNASSEAIRREFMANTRKREVSEFFAGSVDSRTLWYLLTALKVVGAIICAVSFFTVIGLIESSEISPASGIFCAVLIAALESLCFIPHGKCPQKATRK